MQTVQVEVNIDTYQGKKLDKPIAEKVAVEVYENVGELRAAGAYPSDVDVLDFVNGKRKIAARASKTQELTKSMKEDYEKSDDFKVKNLVKAAKLSNMSLGDLETMVAKLFPSYQGDALAGYDA